MILNFLAGRASVQRLHQTVQRNVIRQHRLNIRYQYSRTNAQRNASTIAEAATKRPLLNGATFRSWASPILTPLRIYQGMQKRRPNLTQWETALVIYFLGDLAAQTVQSDFFTEVPFEPIRSLRAVVIGAIIAIPSYKWFLWLGRQFNYRSHVLSLGAKILFSQCVFTPIFNTYFFSMQVLLAGGSVQDAWDRVRNTVPRSWANSWKVWPAVTAMLFTFVAPQNRSAIAGIVAIFWQTYLSWLNRKAEVGLRQKEVLLEEESQDVVARIAA